MQGPLPSPSIPQDKSQGPVERCEFSGFCAQSLETCRVRNLTFAESQIVFLKPSCCLWQFRAMGRDGVGAGSMGRGAKRGWRSVLTGGVYRWGGGDRHETLTQLEIKFIVETRRCPGGSGFDVGHHSKAFSNGN